MLDTLSQQIVILVFMFPFCSLVDQLPSFIQFDDDLVLSSTELTVYCSSRPLSLHIRSGRARRYFFLCDKKRTIPFPRRVCLGSARIAVRRAIASPLTGNEEFHV